MRISWKPEWLCPVRQNEWWVRPSECFSVWVIKIKMWYHSMYFVQGAVRFPGAVGGMASCFLFLLIFSKWPLKDLKHYPRGRCEAMLAGAAFLIPRIFPLIFWHLAGEVQGCWDRRILLGIRIGGRIYFLSELFLLNMYIYIYKFCLLKRLCIQHCSLFLPPPPPPAVPIRSLSLSQQPKKMQAPRAVSWSATKQRYLYTVLVGFRTTVGRGLWPVMGRT